MILLLILAPFVVIPVLLAVSLYAFYRSQLYLMLPVYVCMNVTEPQLHFVTKLIHKKLPNSMVEAMWKQNVRNLLKFRNHNQLNLLT